MPDKYDVIPLSLEQLKTLCTTGLLKSVSISKFSFQDLQMLLPIATVVVLPSPGQN